jgi:Xaa-Pro aminopeptidase
MDVHDVSSISSDTHLRPGMIITVEPGLYIPNIDTVPEKSVSTH